jgi:hypothetical protein
MATDTVKPVDHSHAHIGVVDQRIRKRHAGGASPPLDRHGTSIRSRV